MTTVSNSGLLMALTTIGIFELLHRNARSSARNARSSARNARSSVS
jgi:hypothetical protein